jgi:hypothetical protein
MKFCFPSKFLKFRKEKDHCDWWSVWINLPIVFVGTEVAPFCDINKVWKIDAPTQIKFESNDCWHSFKITFLGFGFGYARQWDY